MSDLPLPKAVLELIDELHASANNMTKKKIDQLARTINATMVKNIAGGEMRVESMVASNTKNPVVIFAWGQNRGELSPIQARQYALQIIESAEAATQDAALYKAIMDTRKPTDTEEEAERMAFAFINMVRDNRRAVERAAEEEDDPNG
jgi:hypothetical protein